MTTLVESELRSVNPATLEVVGSVPVTADVAAVVAVARETRRPSTLAERRALLARLARAVLANMDEIAATITGETGKPLIESYSTELLPAVEQLTWLARNIEHVLAPERLRLGIPYLSHKRAHVVYEPLGVVGIVSPWNFPFSIPLTQAATAVAAGNAVVLKPSELTPLSGEWVVRVFTEAGSDAVRVVHGAGDVGAALVSAPGVAKIVFTGSAVTGRRIAAAAAELLRPVTLELGGKDPMLVLRDADLERAVEGAAWGSFANCGQVCVGIERIYVAREVFPQFVDSLGARARELRIGRGDEPDTDVGPLISEGQRARVEDLVAEAIERGAEAVTGARRPALGLPGWFYEPTVLAGGDAGARIEREEVFGPVVTVQPFDGEDEAVALANASPFGLGASVWSRDAARANRIAAQLDAGMVWTNDLAYSYGVGPAPWGGRKESGYGRTHSKHGLYELSNVKVVDADGGRLGVPWWYPYGERSLDGIRGAVEVLHGDKKLRAAWRYRRGLLHLAKRALRPERFAKRFSPSNDENSQTP
ncbi:MAG: aldehyde dehydrogenase family protein [Gaiellaceae bacterium]